MPVVLKSFKEKCRIAVIFTKASQPSDKLTLPKARDV